MDEDESPTSKSDVSDENELNDITTTVNASIQSPKFIQNASSKALGSLKSLQSTNHEDDEIGDGLRTTTQTNLTNVVSSDTIDLSQTNLSDRIHQHPFTTGKVERKRRKLPEIPKNIKCTITYLNYFSILYKVLILCLISIVFSFLFFF